MKYSVIIPYKDILDLVVRAVKSIPERSDVEVIIINNGTTALPDSLFAERTNVQVLWDAIGKGAGAARNVGLAHAKGEWLVMLDADDFFTQDAFDIMDHHADTDADIVFFHATSCDSDTLEPTDRMSDTNLLIDQYLQTKDDSELRYGWSSPCAKMIRRSMVEEHDIRFDESQVANDILFSVKTGYWAKRIDVAPETIYCATLRQGSLWNTQSLAHLNGRIEASVRVNAFLKTHALREHRKSIMYYLYLIARNYGYGQALKTFWRTVKAGNNPFIGCTRWIQTAHNSQ